MFAIDCGNTRIKWASYEAGVRLTSGHAGLDDPEAYASLGAAIQDVAGPVLIANVAGAEAASALERTVRSHSGLEPEFIRVQPSAYGIRCSYDDPSTLGVDRWLAMIAARRQADGAVIVVAAGTAVTLDAVDSDGRHLGGLILPGESLMRKALADSARQIPLVAPATDPVAGIALLGRSTAEAVGHGTQLALAAAIDRAIMVVTEVVSPDASLIVTGGDGALLASWLTAESTFKEDLVLDGLAVIADEPE